MIGIYIIKCLPNNKVYIGQSINIKNRIKGHKEKLRNNTHYNHYLQSAFNKYGENSFTFDTLCVIDSNVYTEKILNDLEVYYISLFDSANRENGFNIEKGGSSKGKMSEESKEKSRISHTGKLHSKETKELLSKQRKGKPSHLKGRTLNQEHIQKKIDSQLGRVWINNGISTKFVPKEEANKLLQLGYVLGRPFQERIKGKKYEYNGGLYTIPQIAKMCNIDKTVLFARIRNGWTIEKATTTPKIKKDDIKGKHFYKGEYLNLTYISKLVDIDYEVLRSRLRNGMDLDEAISKPIKRRKF